MLIAKILKSQFFQKKKEKKRYNQVYIYISLF